MDRIFELLVDPLGLPISVLWEYGILYLLELTGLIAGWKRFPGGRFGAFIHWSICLLAFFAIWAVSYALIAAAQWIITHWMLVVSVIITATIVCFAAYIMIKGYYCNAIRDEQYKHWEVTL